MQELHVTVAVLHRGHVTLLSCAPGVRSDVADVEGGLVKAGPRHLRYRKLHVKALCVLVLALGTQDESCSD